MKWDSPPTYKEVQEALEPIALDLEWIARRLRQGAISDSLAAVKLRAIAERLES